MKVQLLPHKPRQLRKRIEFCSCFSANVRQHPTSANTTVNASQIVSIRTMSLSACALIAAFSAADVSP